MTSDAGRCQGPPRRRGALPPPPLREPLPLRFPLPLRHFPFRPLEDGGARGAVRSSAGAAGAGRGGGSAGRAGAGLPGSAPPARGLSLAAPAPCGSPRPRMERGLAARAEAAVREGAEGPRGFLRGAVRGECGCGEAPQPAALPRSPSSSRSPRRVSGQQRGGRRALGGAGHPRAGPGGKGRAGQTAGGGWSPFLSAFHCS